MALLRKLKRLGIMIWHMILLNSVLGIGLLLYLYEVRTDVVHGYFYAYVALICIAFFGLLNGDR